jgi:hypothetical protein
MEHTAEMEDFSERSVPVPCVGQNLTRRTVVRRHLDPSGPNHDSCSKQQAAILTFVAVTNTPLCFHCNSITSRQRNFL